MSLTNLERESRKILRQNTAVDGKIARKLVEMILSDKLVSRAEKRFVRSLLVKYDCDDEAVHRLEGVLVNGEQCEARLP